MATRSLPRRKAAFPQSLPKILRSYSDRTDDRINAYVASLELRNDIADDLPGYYRGLGLIKELANSAEDESPPARQLTMREAADVLTFIRNSTPINSVDWWEDRDDRPSPVCGMNFVLGAARDAITSPPVPVAPAESAPPVVTPPAFLNSPLAVLIHRLEVASDKLDLVVAHYPDPSQCYSENLGAIALTRDVSAELNSLYVDFDDYVRDAGLAPQRGPRLDRFPEDLPSAQNAVDPELQS